MCILIKLWLDHRHVSKISLTFWVAVFIRKQPLFWSEKVKPLSFIKRQHLTETGLWYENFHDFCKNQKELFDFDKLVIFTNNTIWIKSQTAPSFRSTNDTTWIKFQKIWSFRSSYSPFLKWLVYPKTCLCEVVSNSCWHQQKSGI